MLLLCQAFSWTMKTSLLIHIYYGNMFRKQRRCTVTSMLSILKRSVAIQCHCCFPFSHTTLSVSNEQNGNAHMGMVISHTGGSDEYKMTADQFQSERSQATTAGRFNTFAALCLSPSIR
mmetsp:Transcript_24052/g.51009  ORF Transcript_24052/g.51009 Transcript_24052/m.51009 type:complete len:119 (-) Transcript_24052:150-506(-)